MSCSPGTSICTSGSSRSRVLSLRGRLVRGASSRRPDGARARGRLRSDPRIHAGRDCRERTVLADHQSYRHDHRSRRDPAATAVELNACYDSRVVSLRRSPLLRAVVAVLLMWTAADLANASLCALDASDMNASVTPSAASAPQQPSHPAPLRGLPSPHVDDCFCCSHCVDMAALTPELLVEPLAAALSPAIPAAPTRALVPTYHPPRA